MRRLYPTDSATLQSNLSEAASLTSEQLQERTVYQLRDLLRHCGIKQVVRDGEQTPIRQATRAELLHELTVATSPYKQLAASVVDTAIVDEDITKLDFESVRDILKFAASLPTDAEREEKARTTAYEVNEWITKTYADSPSLARHFARCNQRGQYRARVGSLIAREGSLLLTGVYGVFADTLSALGKYDAEAKAKANSQRLTTYADNARTVDVDKLHMWLKEVLANPAAHDWKSLAIAVAASTGRRLYSEVLSGTGLYEIESEHELRFTGVAKGKEVNLDSYVIPTIAPATQVVEAIRLLDHDERRVACADRTNLPLVLECRSKAETRHSKNVGEHWNKRLCQQLLDIAPADDSDKEAKDLMKIHGLRKLYVLHYTRGMSDRQVRMKASELLCHSGDGSVAADAYTTAFKLANTEAV